MADVMVQGARQAISDLQVKLDNALADIQRQQSYLQIELRADLDKNEAWHVKADGERRT